ncbi:cob(I)yrinic acid a,c-diamide adenosyltransferase [Marinilabilia salmonicolor]|jgi:cob(I)alamin adenosyltransferase|uniref:Corrinoid adenosyltransferase n=1 Tax=Marinilabilia salmonicolor TaxID=989 RepID=A0A2T0XDI1_9BACT|nr:cob(I)yrinic acid a,c-diamide adenosyltransferase [Marinilabilia salmonicolor]PRY96999.1 cob(I)alamin adenosyltransferase [Marinilabilia salmonicolor]RCW36701.1 cob(I)alamin adenosyltransferase [Marinilabilia salmonicolor]
MAKSQVYTKTGDKGKTSLIGGTRVDKHHYRLEAYGTVDELNANIGMIRSWPNEESINNVILHIQDQLFMIGAYLATDDAVSDLRSRLNSDEAEITLLETEMDKMEETLPPLKNFILPGGHPAATYAHIARTVCRRAERRVNEMAEKTEVATWVIRYLNRLSDYFFVLSRYLSNFYENNEIPWSPKL